MYLCNRNDKRHGEAKSYYIAFYKQHSMDFHIHTISSLCLILFVQTDSCKIQTSVSIDTKRISDHL